MRRLVGRALKWSWYLAAIVLVLCAAVVSLGQYYFPYLGDYREELLARVAGDLPFGVEVAGLGAEWTGLAPTLRVRGLRLFARGDPAVTILSSSRSELRIDMLRSLFSLAPRLRRIVAEDVQLGFDEDADGRWHIAGVAGGAAPPNPEAIVDFFLAIEEIELRRTRLVLRAAEGGRVETEGAELSMENYRRFRRLHVSVRDESPGGVIDLLLESRGDPRQRADFSAAAHLRLDNARLQRLQPLLPPAARLPDAALSGELWARLSQKGELSLQGVLSAPELDPRAIWPERGQLQPLQALALEFAGEWADGKGSLWLQELRCQWFGDPLELERVRIDVERSPGVLALRAGAKYLDVGALAGALQNSGVLGGAWAEALVDLSPYGGLANAHLDLSLPAAGRPDFRFRAAMVDVSASPWRSAPGVRNVRGHLELTPQGGFADIDSGAVSLEFPRVYREELEFDRLAGRVSWQHGPDGVQIGSELLRAAAGSSELSARFDLGLRTEPAADDYLSLAIGLQDADVSAYHSFLPYGASPALQQWLDASIESGHVDSAAFTYHAIFKSAERAASSTMQLALDVRDAAVSYHADWPQVRGAAGRVLIDDGGVRVWLGAGQVLDSRLREATVDVLRQQGERRLRVHVALDGDVADGLRVVNDSPLAAATGGALRDWRASGSMALALDLDMPFGGALAPQSSRLAVVADIDAAQLFIAEPGLQLEGVRGTLAFDLERGLHSERIDATLWGRPLRAAIVPGDPPTRRMAIRVEGGAALARVAEWLKWDLDEYLAGETPFTVDIAQQEQRGFGFTVRSELRGAGSTLPAPLAKAPDEALPLELRWTPGADGADIGLQLGPDIKGALHRDRQGRFSGEIAIGAEALPGGEDLRITGRLPACDAGAWIAAIRQVAAANAARGGGGTTLRLAGLEAASATLLGAELHGLRVDSRWEGRDFVLSFAADAVAGDVRLPGTASPYALTLERLQLRPFLGPAAPAPEQGGTADAARTAVLDDAEAWRGLQDVRVPETEVLIRSLALDARDLGAWSFRIGSEIDALALTEARGSLPGLVVGGPRGKEGGSFRVRWLAGEPRSELEVGLRSDDITRFSTNWGYANVIESRDGRADVSFSWPGNPAQFAMVAVTGSADFSFRDGRLLLERGNNPIMRGLGVLSFDEVLRRMRLDFKDFYQKGLAFDRFRGAVDLGGGEAHTREPVTLDGPSARIKFSGRSDLRARTIDADLIVTLPIGSNLPWVAALAGGLPAAAGAYVASRIFENQLGKFSSAVYKVGGKLDEPELEFVRVFDTKEASREAEAAAAASRADALPMPPEGNEAGATAPGAAPAGSAPGASGPAPAGGGKP